MVVPGPPLAKLHARDERRTCSEKVFVEQSSKKHLVGKAWSLDGPRTRVMAAGFPPVVSVLPAAALLLQAGAALAAVTGLSLDLTHAHPHRRLAGVGAAAPEAPLAHGAVLSCETRASVSRQARRSVSEVLHMHSRMY